MSVKKTVSSNADLTAESAKDAKAGLVLAQMSTDSNRREEAQNAQKQTSEIESKSEIGTQISGRWADYLAKEPEVGRQFAALVEQIRAGIAEFRPQARDAAQRVVDLAEHGRQIGIAVVEMEELFAGKKLTEDFWRQIEPVFVDKVSGQKVTRDLLLWFGRIARNNLAPITEPKEAQRLVQGLLQAAGESEFALVSERAPQVAHAPEVPLSLLKDTLKFSRLSVIWKRVREDGTSFENGRLRPDLVPVLRVELEPTIRIVDELRRELGI